MIEFITRHADDISFWLMSAIAIVSNILLHKQKKAYRNVAEKHRALSSYIVDKETELRSIVNAVNDFIDEHNYWHDRKIAFYFDHDGWHCCYCDEIPKGDIVPEQEEINAQNKNNNENN